MRRFIKLVSMLVCISFFLTVMSNIGLSKVTLRVTDWWGDAFNEVIAEAQKQFPDLEIKHEPRPYSGYHDKLLVEIAAGTGPDIYFVDAYWFGRLFSAGVFLPLSKLAQKDPIDFKKFVLDPRFSHKYGNDFYGLPQWIEDNPVLWVNKDLCKESGIVIPEYGTTQFNKWRWKDLLTAAQKTTKKGPDGKNIQWGLSNPGTSPWVHMLLIWLNGGEIVDDPQALKETKCTLDQPKAIEAIQFLVDLTNRYRVQMTPSESELLAAGAYLSGKVAFTWGWNIYGDLKKATFDWTVIPIPWQTRKVTKYGGNSWVISKATKYPEEAWKLIKWFTTDPKARKMFASKGTISNYAPEELFKEAESPKQKMIWEMLTACTKGVTFRPWRFGSKNPALFNQIWQSQLDLAFLEGKPVVQAMKDAANEINEKIYSAK